MREATQRPRTSALERAATGVGPARLLVSVSDGLEAAEALAGGADIIDAKDPSRGALGPVALETLRGISSVVGERPLTAAIGDDFDASAVEQLAYDFACAGVHAVKIGLAASPRERSIRIIDAAIRGARGSGHPCGVVVVTYVDRCQCDLGDPRALIPVAAARGAAGVLLDTADKAGPGLTRLVSTDAVRRWIDTARRHALLAAVAGKLALEDIGALIEAGADIVGVRGAACVGGRTGRISASRVSMLRDVLRADPASPGESEPRARPPAIWP